MLTYGPEDWLVPPKVIVYVWVERQDEAYAVYDHRKDHDTVYIAMTAGTYRKAKYDKYKKFAAMGGTSKVFHVGDCRSVRLPLPSKFAVVETYAPEYFRWREIEIRPEG